MTVGIIFDMDGVLIKSEEFYFQRRMNFFSEKKISPAKDQLIDFVGKTEGAIWQTLVPENESLRQQLRREYLNYREVHPLHFLSALRKEAVPLLDQLKKDGFPLALASSSPKKEIQRMLSECNLQKYFSFVISGEDLKESKPHPEIYLLAKEALACKKYLAVEDSPLGIQSAKAADIFTVALKQSYQVDQSQADYVIRNLLELVNLPQLTR